MRAFALENISMVREPQAQIGSDRIGTGRAEHRGWNHVRDTRAPTAERGAGNEYASGQSGTERNAESREETSREKPPKRETNAERGGSVDDGCLR